jgi:AraC family transcriptional regulator
MDPGRAASTLRALSCEQFRVSLSDYRVGLQQGWHSHDHPILTLILAGHAREQVGCHELVAGPLTVGLKPAGLRHTDDFGPHGVRALRILFAPAFFAGQETRLHALDRWDWIVGSLAIGPLLRLAHGLRQEALDEAAAAEFVQESVAGLLPSPAGRADAAPSWLRRARECLDATYAEGTRLTRLAREARVHPIDIARQFRRFFGCSVGRYVRQLQFRAAAALLAECASLAQVACRVGFSDQAHLTRTFACEFGITPGELRRIVS